MSALKKFERGFKKFINSLIFNVNNPIIIESQKEIFKGSLKILILRQDRIGDLIISSSIIKTIRNRLPDATIEILLSNKNESASASISNFVDNIFIYRKKLISIIKLVLILRKNKYDLVVDLFDNASTTSSLLIKYVKGKYSLGFAKENSSIYTHIVPLLNKKKIHIIDRISQILLPFGINPENLDLAPFYPLNDEKRSKAYEELSSQSKKTLVAINVSGSDRSKYLGTENLKELISLCQSKLNELELILFNTKEDEAEIKSISSEMRVAKASLFQDFDSYANYLSICDIIITPDTAAVHLASAFKQPCIALYKGLSEISDIPWYPYKTKYISIETEGNTISNIPPMKIIEALRSIMEK